MRRVVAADMCECQLNCAVACRPFNERFREIQSAPTYVLKVQRSELCIRRIRGKQFVFVLSIKVSHNQVNR